jgi:diguanylate cyclase (GGDEF)-like protein/PAS domain S-box-containing protein
VIRIALPPEHGTGLRLTRRILGTIVLMLALVVMVGWLARFEIMRIAAPHTGTMLFNTALCLALISLGVILLDGASTGRRWTLLGLGAAVVAVAGMTMIEHLTGASLGIDQPELHRWLQVNAPAPGRMSPGVCTSMLLLGSALCLWPFVERNPYAGTALQSLVLLAMLAAVLGMLVRELQLDYLYSSYVFSTMSEHTALSIAMLGGCFWLAWYVAPWNRLLRFDSSENRIMSLGVLILLVIAVSAGSIGFYVSKDTLEEDLKDNLVQSLRAHARLIEDTISHRVTLAEAIASRPNLQILMREHDRRAGNAATLRQLSDEARRWLLSGFRGIAFRDSTGNTIVQVGNFSTKSELVLSLVTDRHRVSMTWDEGLYLVTEVTMFAGSEHAWTIIAEHLVSNLTSALFDPRGFGETGEIELCGLTALRATCFPTRFSGKRYVYPEPSSDNPFPIYRALSRQTGSEYARDYRRARVFAAYGPVGDYGLGIVLKTDITELRTPLRKDLQKTLPTLALLVAIGVLMLRWRVRPLARQLALNEQRLKMALHASRRALWDWDLRSGQAYLGEQWQEILGGDPQPTTTLDALRDLMHPDDALRADQHLRDTLSGKATLYDIELRVRKVDGGWLWIRSRGKIVERSSSGQALRMVGMNSDISSRVQMQEQLTHQANHDLLTGLPNRGLFHDRLKQAIARSRRSSSQMAVMYLDIDKFKSINDTLGHDVGDELLKAFSQRLADCVRGTDTVARMGGDEYAVILESIGARENGCRIAEKIVTSMRPEFKLGGHALSISTSLGIAFYDGSGELAPDTLVKQADTALYSAKAAGRNNYQIYAGAA